MRVAFQPAQRNTVARGAQRSRGSAVRVACSSSSSSGADVNRRSVLSTGRCLAHSRNQWAGVSGTPGPEDRLARWSLPWTTVHYNGNMIICSPRHARESITVGIWGPIGIAMLAIRVSDQTCGCALHVQRRK